MGRAADKIKKFFKSIPGGIGKAIDWVGDTTAKVITNVGKVTTAGTQLTTSAFNASPFGQISKTLLIGGAAVIGAVILWTFLNPKETSQLVTNGMNTARTIVTTVPIPI